MGLKDMEGMNLRRLKYNKDRIDTLKSRTSAKRQSMRMFSYLYPYLLILYLLVQASRLISRSLSDRLTVYFLKHYANLYFSYRGIHSLYGEDFNTKLDKPSLIFTTRHHIFSSFYAFKMFKTPVIIPLHESFYRSRLVPYIPFPTMGSLFKKISYPDQHITYNVDRIKSILEAGHSVVVYINESYTDEVHYNMLYVGKEVFDLLKLDVPTYFLCAGDMHQYAISTISTPLLVTLALKEKNDLFNDIETKDDQHMAARICEFFLMRYINIVD